jgi:hypothetical protein
MTSPHDARLASYDQLCQPARRLALFSDQIIAKVTDQTGQEQIQDARYALTALYETLARQLDFTHHIGPPGQIFHPCIREVFFDAAPGSKCWRCSNQNQYLRNQKNY